jgi:hypothetical protein
VIGHSGVSECKGEWLLKNSFGLKSQKQNCVTKRFKRSSRISRHFMSPKFWPFPLEWEFFNSHATFRQAPMASDNEPFRGLLSVNLENGAYAIAAAERRRAVSFASLVKDQRATGNAAVIQAGKSINLLITPLGPKAGDQPKNSTTTFRAISGDRPSTTI